MIVSKENLDLWRKFSSGGEYSGNYMRLVEKADLHYMTVRSAIESGVATLRTIRALNKAAIELEREIKQAISIPHGLNSPIV